MVRLLRMPGSFRSKTMVDGPMDTLTSVYHDASKAAACQATCLTEYRVQSTTSTSEQHSRAKFSNTELYPTQPDNYV